MVAWGVAAAWDIKVHAPFFSWPGSVRTVGSTFAPLENRSAHGHVLYVWDNTCTLTDQYPRFTDSNKTKTPVHFQISNHTTKHPEFCVPIIPLLPLSATPLQTCKKLQTLSQKLLIYGTKYGFKIVLVTTNITRLASNGKSNSSD
ncbi:hypothetical protein C1H46_042787 [Malus baccata]|uniref:Uncharacterized protein n=1 Tax=Malus baccata TaxID=106549 RepID=A0A540KBT0_MALBA|nr:hypothetical protein C1H46_042787 [Malus baccata]